MREDNRRSKRRDLLKYIGTGSFVALAGCSASQTPGGGSSQNQTTSGGGQNTMADPSEVERGGKPVVGLSNKPRGFNPLVISDQAAWAIMDRMYPYPTARDPQDINNTVGFLFKNWSFDPDSLTGKATLYDGFKWSDGKDVTAEDVVFTINYMKEQDGNRYQGNATPVKDIGTTGKNSLEFTLKTEIAAVFTPSTGVFGVPILPKQRWKDVDDYTKFSPDTLIGAAGFSWGSKREGNWYELEAAPDLLPDEVHPGPYVDRLRFLVFESQTAMATALKKGTIDQTYASITPSRALQLQDGNNIKIWKSNARGYDYIALNLRRVPFDDQVFRWGLGFAYPYNYLVNKLRKGLSVPGDYVAASIYDPWRPDSFEQPFDHGPHQFKDGTMDVEKVRDYLRNADGKHTYTFGPVKSSEVTGEKEIRVDGKLLPEAHTNNTGDPGQGPLEVMINPPSKSPITARASAKFVENLKKVGIPTVKQPVAENSQSPLVWGQEQFDMWSSGWIYMPKPHMFMRFWLTSKRADLYNPPKDAKSQKPGDQEAYHLNPMGYTGADDIIKKAATTYPPEQQQQYTRKALATIYEDAPVIVTEYPNRLHATTKRFDGWVMLPGGISQVVWTYLNLHLAE